jgi:hypothetical protein
MLIYAEFKIVYLKSIFILIIVLFGSLAANSQQVPDRFTISGYVRDSASGEELIGANIIISELPSTGATTNAYGFYSITLPAGLYTLMTQYVGFQIVRTQVSLDKNIRLDFSIAESINRLSEVIISSEPDDANVSNTRMGVEKIEIREIENIPVLMGERDVLKTLQLKPGVKSAGEGNSGFYVRGGTADQNLILLDEASVFNASHLLGFFSVFNSDALKDITFFKGTQPAEYGSRLSSVLDIRMQEGNNRHFGAEGGIGLISSRLKVEGPIVKEKGSFTVSGRRTYADLFLKLSPDTTINRSILYFYDLNAKANIRLNERNRVYLSGYFGKDVLGLDKIFGFDWGNATATFRWNRIVNEKLFSNTSLIFSNYNYNIHIDLGSIKAKIISRIQDYNFKQDFQFYPASDSRIRFGLNSIYHRIIPGAITIDSDLPIGDLELNNNYALENAAYISHEYKPVSAFGIEYGFRISSFTVLGPGEFYRYDNAGKVMDTTTFLAGELVKSYIRPEPRVAISYMLGPSNSLKASYTRNVQNLHLLSNSTSGNPTDLWIPSSLNVQPETADQVSLGYFRNFNDNTWEFSAEAYYKSLNHQIDYKDGAELNFNQIVESQLLYGHGRAYGLELFLKKRYGRLNGWIGYTLARTEKRIEGINDGKYYPAKQDRTHDVSLVGIYDISRKWTLSATWVYYTGNAVTFPSGKYQVDGRILNYYTERNFRKRTDKFESSWSFSIYNVYGRENAYVIDFRENPEDPSVTQAVRLSLFRWVPSVTYNFKF